MRHKISHGRVVAITLNLSRDVAAEPRVLRFTLVGFVESLDACKLNIGKGSTAIQKQADGASACPQQATACCGMNPPPAKRRPSTPKSRGTRSIERRWDLPRRWVPTR